MRTIGRDDLSSVTIQYIKAAAKHSQPPAHERQARSPGPR
jgi:hypothetical protein